MKKRERVEFIMRELEKLYPDPAIPLDHSDAYTLLIAVLLSAQCTDARVNTVTPKLFAKASSPDAMVKLSVEEIREIIRPCGLSPAKSKNIHRLSEILLEEYEGVVPADMEKLEALPGVGHKTAGVVMIQAFGVPAFPVDTHIHRMLYRWGLSNGSSVEQTERDAKRLFPQLTWIKLHLQIIYYAREFSPALGAKEERDFITMEVSGKIKKLKK
jgi:endonuclease-3